ncbi:endonuclease/exonuclease/phosphatase family metal-dependent hydrolase [Propionicimonas paludicola]|uniref:Endonuclease/exonuclease/phosphatase family metal-dependent hydrolase n=1 Tax=Propionicimonas paludicola TaxID=185243 RepID=A0A2A9CTQ7_9ACTN|nr:fibronectin type III domain-containing protein [Propionicimonas paludicola]PFG17833.1 endonuclease/exonuclease/phosphatase family metal-dependent hydrolase [Propionicimonas paludicola]
MPSLRIRQRDGRRSLLIVALSLALSASLLLVAPGRAWAAKYAKPTGLTATVSANTVALTWKAVKGAPGYRVQFSTEPKMNTFATLDVVKPYVEWTNLDMDPNRNAPRLSPNTTYYFRVKVITLAKANLTSYSKILKVKTAKADRMAELPPIALKATTQSPSSMYLSWSSRGPGVVYRIRYGTGKKLPLGKSQLAHSEYPGMVLSGLAAGTKYYYKVRVLTPDRLGYRSDYSTTGSFTTAKKAGSPVLKVGTYNLCSSPCAGWNGTREPAAVANIAAQSLDVLYLQEISTSKLPNFLTALNAASGRRYVSTDPANRNVSNTTRLVYDANRLSMKPSEHGIQKLPIGNSSTQKYAVWAVLEDQLSGKRFFAASTHLIAGDGYSALRRTQSEELVRLIKTANVDQLPVLLGGDFNSGKSSKPDNPVYDVMSGAGLREPLGNPTGSWAISSAATTEHRIDLDYNSYNDYLPYAKRSKYPNAHDIDYIWHSPKVRIAMTQMVVQVDASRKWVGVLPSDHNLLTAWVHLP